MNHEIEKATSNSSGDPAIFGYTEDDRLLFCFFQPLDDLFVLPVTAYEVDEIP